MYTCRQILENYRHKQQQLFGVVGWRTVFLFPCVIVNFQIRKFPDSRIGSPSVNSTVVWIEAWSYCQMITSRTVNAIQPFSFNEANCHPKSVEEEHSAVCVCAQSCLTLYHPMDCSPTRLLCPWNFPGKNTGLGCHALLQRIFPTQELNPSLLRRLHWQADSLPAELPGKPKCKYIHT